MSMHIIPCQTALSWTIRDHCKSFSFQCGKIHCTVYIYAPTCMLPTFSNLHWSVWWMYGQISPTTCTVWGGPESSRALTKGCTCMCSNLLHPVHRVYISLYNHMPLYLFSHFEKIGQLTCQVEDQQRSRGFFKYIQLQWFLTHLPFKIREINIDSLS